MTPDLAHELYELAESEAVKAAENQDNATAEHWFTHAARLRQACASGQVPTEYRSDWDALERNYTKRRKYSVRIQLAAKGRK